MIPRRAFVYWDKDGPPMGLLQKASLDTWCKIHPDIPLVILDTVDLPVGTDTRRKCAVRSDVARYKELAENGGIYFDTDIIWAKRLPEEWFANDAWITGTTYEGKRVVAHIGLLAAGGNGMRIFRDVYLYAQATATRHGDSTGYQEVGVSAWGRLPSCGDLASRYGATIIEVPYAAVMNVTCADVAALWRNGKMEDRFISGVHWFGGDPVSQDNVSVIEREGRIGAVDCYLTRLIGKVMGEEYLNGR